MWNLFSQYRAYSIRCLLALVVPFVHPVVVVAQAPLLTDATQESGIEAGVLDDWKRRAAEQALHAGLPSIAEQIYRELLTAGDRTEVQLAELQVQLAAAYIAQQRFDAALAALREVPHDQQRSVFWLYASVAQYGYGLEVDYGALRAALAKVNQVELLPTDRPWYFLMEGLVEEGSAGQPAAIEAAWSRAVAAASSEVQAAFFRSLIVRQKLMSASTDEALVAEMRAQLERLDGAAAFAYAREYAVLLYNMLRRDEAIAVIDAQLDNAAAGYGARAREQLRLVRAMMIGANVPEGRLALRELVRSGQDRAVMEVALQLLARADNAEGELSDFLNEMITRSEAHPLLGQMYYMRCQLALFRNEIAVAEADARYLLEQFPGMSQITNVYQLLAYAALQRTPPQYRTAANLLSQLRDQSESLQEQALLNKWIGDCYFLNQDYANAADFYRAAQAVSDSDSGLQDELFLRIVTADVRSGDLTAAIDYLESVSAVSDSVSVRQRWQAEWNIAQALQAQGKLDTALERIRQLLQTSGDRSVPVALDLRLRWLSGRLALLLGEVDGLNEAIEALQQRVASLPVGMLDESEAALLTTELLFLQAEAFLRLGDATGGIEVLLRLREAYPQSDAAERSYLAEAQHHATLGDFKTAQETLLSLTRLYPKSRLAAQALFEAALYCEQRGVDSFADAVRLHNDFVERFPDDALLFSARLKQGDLLRRMNDFAGAQIVYETLIYRFPNHTERFVAELSRAECLLALANNEAGQLEEVASILERLMDLPNIPVDFQMEIVYKWAFSLTQMGARERARAVYFMAVERFLINASAADRLGVTGRYWAGRAMLDLGALLEESGALTEARKIYRQLQAYDLPGRSLAESRARRLPLID